MANPVKIQATTPKSLKEMSNTELDYTVYQILNTFAGTQSGVGTLNINGSGTSIGSFTDTIRTEAVGTHPASGTTTSTVYDFKQDLTTAAESLTRPIEFSSGALREQDDTSLNATVIDYALDTLVADGLGSYLLQPSTPTETGTWTSIATVTDSTQTGNNTTQLWRRTGATAPSAVRPLKSVSNGVKELTDAEMQTLTARLRNRIVATGKGKYAVQPSAPTGGGTWVRQGTAFSDTRQDIADQTYTGYYNQSYEGYYAQGYVRTFQGLYNQTYTRNWAGGYVRNWAGGYVRAYRRTFGGVSQGPNYNRTWTGYYARTYTGYYARGYVRAWAGEYNQTFTRNWAGTYVRAWAGGYVSPTIQASTVSVSDASLWLRIS